MGGYGGSSGKAKSNCYFDSGNHKVTDKNAITVGEYFIDNGDYVVFLQERPPSKRADLSVSGQHIEVKGISSTSTNKIANTIKKAFEQVSADDARYSSATNRSGEVVVLSKHGNIRTAYKAIYGGFRKAKKLGFVKGIVEMWYKDKKLIFK